MVQRQGQRLPHVRGVHRDRGCAGVHGCILPSERHEGCDHCQEAGIHEVAVVIHDGHMDAQVPYLHMQASCNICSG